MAKQFDNPYAAGAASSSRKAQPKRPVYDFEQDAKAKGKRQSGRISYGAGEIIPPPSMPNAPQAPMEPQRRTTVPPPKRTQPIRASKGVPYDTAKYIEPIAVVTPQGRSQRRPSPQMHGHLRQVPTDASGGDRPLGQTTQRRKQQSSAESKKQVRFPVRKKTAPPAPRAEVQARASGASSPKPAREISYKDVRRRQFQRSLMLVFGAVVALLMGFVLSVTVLFKIETIAVEFTEESPYTPEQVLALLDFQQGDNLFTFRAEKTAERLTQNLPYLEAVTIQRRLPGTVNVVAQPVVERYGVNSDFGWAILSEKLKVLRLSVEQPAGLIALYGVQASIPTVGQEVVFTDETTQPKANLQTVMAELKAQGMENIWEVNLSSDLELSFLYEGRVRVLLGTTNELAKKIEWAKDIITTSGKITPEEKGTLDVSTRYKDGQLLGNWRAGRL